MSASRTSSGARLRVGIEPRYRFVHWLNRIVWSCFFRLRADGVDRWPEPPFQIVVNHHNGFDPLLVMAVTPLEPRITWFGPKERDFSRGFKNRVMGFFGGVIPYDPAKASLVGVVRTVRGVFAAGGVLGIFAEGKVGFHESALQPFEPGAVVFASSAGVPIVPCAVIGTTRLYLGRRVVVRFGDPIPTSGVRTAAQREELERRVRSAIEAMLPASEPPDPGRRALDFLTDILNGPEVPERRRQEGVAGGPGAAPRHDEPTSRGSKV